MNSQNLQESDKKRAIEYLAGLDKTLGDLKEAEVKLQDLKYKLEFMVNVFQSSDSRKQKMVKDSVNLLGIYEKFEEIILKNVLPSIKPIKPQTNPALYQKYTKNQHLYSSLKVYRDEIASTFQDSSVYKDFKAYSNVFSKSEKGSMEISYDVLLSTLKSLGQIESGLLIRFDKSLDFNELPETFIFCFIRADLITITLTFRKAPLQELKNESEAVQTDKNKVNLVNTVYSNLFDGGVTSQCQKREQFYLFPPEFRFPNDPPQIIELKQVIQQNQHRVGLPCIYPNMSVFQRFSHHTGERIESIYKMIAKEKDNRESNQTKIIAMILKQFPDEFTTVIENKCGICRKRFILDSSYQKMLPPLHYSKEQRGERLKILHLECKKIYKNDNLAPQVIVEVDCSDESSLFDNSL